MARGNGTGDHRGCSAKIWFTLYTEEGSEPDSLPPLSFFNPADHLWPNHTIYNS